MVLLEAMAAARPVVVTDVGENRSIVRDGNCGVVIPARDPGAIAEAIVGLLADPERARTLGARAHERFVQRFTVEAMTAAYSRLFLGEVAGPRPVLRVGI